MNPNKKPEEDFSNWVLLILLLAGAFTLWGLWLGWGHRYVTQEIVHHAHQQASAPSNKEDKERPQLNDVMSHIGQSGDAFGGANALFAALAGAAVVWAGVLQIQTLKKTREALEHERAARKIEQFEAKFFRMLDLTRSIVLRINKKVRPSFRVMAVVRSTPAPSPPPPLVGDDALDAFADVIHRAMLEDQKKERNYDLRRMVHYFYSVYGINPSAFGTYFRLLFQTFRAIDESGIDEDQQVHYANIARGQISNGAVLLLALNGLSHYGRDFVYYIEKFGLLKHLLDSHDFLYKGMLIQGYRQRAFMGSERRRNEHLDKSPLAVEESLMWSSDEDDLYLAENSVISFELNKGEQATG